VNNQTSKISMSGKGIISMKQGYNSRQHCTNRLLPSNSWYSYLCHCSAVMPMRATRDPLIWHPWLTQTQCFSNDLNYYNKYRRTDCTEFDENSNASQCVNRTFVSFFTLYSAIINNEELKQPINQSIIFLTWPKLLCFVDNRKHHIRNSYLSLHYTFHCNWECRRTERK